MPWEGNQDQRDLSVKNGTRYFRLHLDQQEKKCVTLLYLSAGSFQCCSVIVE